MATEAREQRIVAMQANRQAGFIVLLENITDPHNAEAVLRSCDAFGVGEVWFVHENVPGFNPKRVGKKTSGSANKWLTFKNWSSTGEALDELERLGYVTVGTVLAQDAETIYEARFPETKIALLLGNEHAGLSSPAIARVQRKLIIPMRGMVQSLNISVAAAVCIYEITRQRLSTGISVSA